MSNANLPPVFLLGATATGKTAIAIALCQRLPMEIISVDSALVYRRMDIGTAKPDAQERALAPHRLIDIIEPWETYSVSDFIRDAQREIRAVQARGHVPLLVGGTMLYFKALTSGLSHMPGADPAIRAQIVARAEAQGWADMHRELAAVDPDAAHRIHPNDPQRIQRALEVWHASGQSMTHWHQSQETSPTLQALQFGLFPQQRDVLHARIETRFDHMLAAGFLDEVAQLRCLPGMHAALPSMRCVGYRQAWDHLDGEVSHDEMRARALAATRQLAKRQLTWMRKMPQLTTFDSVARDPEEIVQTIADTVSSHLTETE